MTQQAFRLDENYLSLDGRGAVARHDGGAAFWSKIRTRTDLIGPLVAYGRNESDWNHWEMHPAGDEILFLTEGEMILVLELPGGEERVLLRPHEAFVVPAGVWHRALVPKPARLLSVTPGAGTQHKPI